MDEISLKMMMKERLADRQREAAEARLRRMARKGRPGVRRLALEALGNGLIHLGQAIKERYGRGPDSACMPGGCPKG